MAYYLAVDIGASSGRHILGSICDGKLVLEEIYRFENGMDKVDGSLVWDVERLTNEVINGLKRCAELGKIPDTMAIDTWGVDYVLLDKDDAPILPVYAYRDGRTTRAVIDEAESAFEPDELYRRTGVQKQAFNTVYQLCCDRVSRRLDRAERFLMIPEYLYYRLTGVKKNEYTEASTTGLLNAKGKTWDSYVLEKLGIPARIFGEINTPSTPVGGLRAELREELGFDTQLVLAACHDTASAVAACPLDDESMYISSGTWSLVGVELEEPITTAAAQASNLTNEGGVDWRFRFLKNIMGMWLFQSIRRDTGKVYSYDEMMNMAQASDFDGLIDVNAAELVAPENMPDAIRGLLGKPDLPIGDVLACVYNSLATLYATTADELESITGKPIRSIHIVGGGGADTYLNRLTAEKSGRRVFTGLKEATATGNILAQIMYAEKDMDLKACRELVKKSFSIKETQI